MWGLNVCLHVRMSAIDKERLDIPLGFYFWFSWWGELTILGLGSLCEKLLETIHDWGNYNLLLITNITLIDRLVIELFIINDVNKKTSFIWSADDVNTLRGHDKFKLGISRGLILYGVHAMKEITWLHILSFFSDENRISLSFHPPHTFMLHFWLSYEKVQNSFFHHYGWQKI